jgi:hypothetical protein
MFLVPLRVMPLLGHFSVLLLKKTTPVFSAADNSELRKQGVEHLFSRLLFALTELPE